MFLPWNKPGCAHCSTLNEVYLKRLVGDAAHVKKQKDRPDRDAAEIEEEKRVKVAGARERYLARKAGSAR